LKEEALDRNMWRVRFGRGFETVVRERLLMNEYCIIYYTIYYIYIYTLYTFMLHIFIYYINLYIYILYIYITQ